MKQILVYGDSLSWGIIPGSRKRLAWGKRWPSILEQKLNEGSAGPHDSEKHFRIHENCLNGRRTVWDDPFKAGRNGRDGLAQLIEIHSPLSLVILMLGTNDFQSMHPHTAWHSAQGVHTLVRTIQSAPIEPGMPVPPLLIIAPPPATEAKGTMANKFKGAETKCAGLAGLLKSVADEHGAYFFDAASVIEVSPIDGVHLDAAEHKTLGEALVLEIKNVFNAEATLIVRIFPSIVIAGFAGLIVATTATGCGNYKSGKFIGWRYWYSETSIRATYATFDGLVRRTYKWQGFTKAVFDCRFVVAKGQLRVELTPPSGSTHHVCAAGKNEAVIQAVDLPGDGDYQITVHGREAGGSFHVRWLLE